MTATSLFCFLTLSFALMRLHFCEENSKWGISNNSLEKGKINSENAEEPSKFMDDDTVPSNTRVINLYSKTEKFLEILPSGRMRGTSDRRSLDARLEVQIFGIKYRRFKREKSDIYLAFNKNGKPYARKFAAPDTLFEAFVEKDGWIRYQNVKYGWMLAVKKNGRLKKATKPNLSSGKQPKSMQFLTLFPDKTPWKKAIHW